MIRQVLIALTLFLIPATASAGSAEIEHRCTVLYPNISQYFAWRDCVKLATQQEAEEDLKRQREEAARPCVAADITRMEGLAARAKAAVKPEWTLEEAQAALNPIIGHEGPIQIPQDGIKDRVLIYQIQTRCDSPFHFVVNVREGPDKKLRWVRMAAIDPPAGYPANIHPEFGVDFEAQREEEQRRAERAKSEELQRAELAREDQVRKQRRQATVNSIKISNIHMTCADTCAVRDFTFIVTNGSAALIHEIYIGWMFPSPQIGVCPAELVSKMKKDVFLQPGGTTFVSIAVTDAPAINDGKYCLKVTDVGGFF